MNHFVILLICFFSIEIFIRSNYLTLVKSLTKVIKKAIYVILNKKISDHWKENIIPRYSFQIMKHSVQMILILFTVIFIFVIADKLFSGVLAFTFSLNGIIESILFAFSYAYLRKLIFK